MKLQAVLPLVTYPDPNSDHVAAHAVAVAAKLGASLHALALNVEIAPVSSTFSRLLLDVPAMIREARAQSLERGKHLLALVEEQAVKAGVALSSDAITAAPPLLGEAAAAATRYFDLALVGWDGQNTGSRMVAEAVVFGSGKPVVLLPDMEAAGFDHVAIAWDGSRVAARAVADAGSFLARAEKISVLTVNDEKQISENECGEKLAERLREGGLQARSHMVVAKGRPIGAVLQDYALELGAGLLVMGGYGHSRIRDFVLGGATEGVLDNLRLPALLSH